MKVKIIDARTIVNEVTNEAIKLYNDYSHLSIWQAIDMAEKLVQGKYRDYEVVDGD